MLTRYRPFTIVVSCVWLVAVSALVLRPVMLARSLRNDIDGLAGRSLTESQLRVWAEKHGGDVNCHRTGCTVEVANWFLDTLHLSPPTRFLAGITIRDGRVASSSLSLVSAQYGPQGPSGAVTRLTIAYEPPNYFREPLVRPYVGHGPVGGMPQVDFVVSARCGAKALEMARQINIWCLALPGGCRSGEKQAPDVWKLPEMSSPGYDGRPGTDLLGQRPGGAVK